MLDIVFLVLKILGFTLLGIIGLILLILLAVLFVPVRYRATAQKYDDIDADARIYWLFHILRIRATYKDKKLKLRGRLLFFKIINEDADEDELKDKHKSSDDAPDFPDTDDLEDEDGAKEERAKEEPYKEETVKEERVKEETAKEETAKEETVKEEPDKDKPAEEGAGKEALGEEESDDKSSKELKKKNKNKKSLKNREKNVKNQDKNKTGIVKKVKNLYNIKKDREVRRFLSVAWKRLKKVIKHILPGKVKGHVRFGTNDPESTGKILGGVAMLYPLYAGALTVIPSFEEKVLEGEIFVKGRIRLFTVGVPILRTYRSKDMKRLRKKVKKALNQ